MCSPIQPEYAGSRFAAPEHPHQGFPGHPVVDAGVAVDQDVTQGADPASARKPRRRPRIDPRQLAYRLADDLQLPLHARTKQRIGQIVVERLAGGDHD